MARNIGGRDGVKYGRRRWLGKRWPENMEEEMFRNIKGREGQKYGRRRWLELLGEEVARNMEGGDG